MGYSKRQYTDHQIQTERNKGVARKALIIAMCEKCGETKPTISVKDGEERISMCLPCRSRT